MKYQRSLLIILIILLGLIARPGKAQQKTSPKHEFRGAWIATVINLDWPNSRTGRTPVQKYHLREMLDKLDAAGINVAFFQVRSEADAFYDSKIEPWSYWLTGEQGKAPDPFYDPLRYAVQEAHKRGMELHAWFNPYRADRGNSYQPADNHVTQQHPDWILQFGEKEILNPGLPQVRDYITRVIMDVVRRYDVDGVHFDDYFYPYPPDNIGGTGKDKSAFEKYSRGFENIADWRRDNVNVFVKQVHDSIQVAKPNIAFGISPFGIWKNGVPSGISGLSSYRTIYADAVAWLRDQSIDYLTPQLYWRFGGSQDYATLAPWWADKASSNNRHLYPGLGLYKSDDHTISSVKYDASVVPRQVRFNQQREHIQGEVFFRAKNITRYNSRGIVDSLQNTLYAHPALTPTMPWKDMTAPAMPTGLETEWTGDASHTLRLFWTAPDSTADAAAPQRYAVYRVRAAEAPDPTDALQHAKNLIAVTGDTSYSDKPVQAAEPYHYFVTAASRNAIESAPSEQAQAQGRVPSAAEEPSEARAPFALKGNAPNPFRGATTIRFALERPAAVTLRVYDVLGRRVRMLTEEKRYGAGRQAVRFEAGDLPAGVYFYRLQAGGYQANGKMVLAR